MSNTASIDTLLQEAALHIATHSMPDPSWPTGLLHQPSLVERLAAAISELRAQRNAAIAALGGRAEEPPQ